MRVNKADVIVEHEVLFVVPSVVRLEGLLPCFGTGEGATKFLVLVPECSDEISEFNSFFV